MAQVQFESAIHDGMDRREKIACAIWEGRPGHATGWYHLPEARRNLYREEADFIIYAADLHET